MAKTRITFTDDFVLRDERVGINTADPQASLDVGGELRVSGVSTFTDIVTTITDLYVGGDLYVQNNLVVNSFTANSFVVTGIATASRFVGNLTGNLNSTGVSTATTLSGSNLNYTGVGTITNISGSNLNYTGVSTATTLSGSNLSYSGVSTFTNGPVLIGSGTSTGTSLQRLQVTGGAYVSGNLGIGTTNPTEKLHVVGDVLVGGDVSATQFTSLSDSKYKTNVVTISGSLDKVEKLRGVRFDWKDSGFPSYGVIAEELQEVLPELVYGNDPKTVNYNGIIGVLIEAIKEQQVRIEELERKLNV